MPNETFIFHDCIQGGVWSPLMDAFTFRNSPPNKATLFKTVCMSVVETSCRRTNLHPVQLWNTTPSPSTSVFRRFLGPCYEEILDTPNSDISRKPSFFFTTRSTFKVEKEFGYKYRNIDASFFVAAKNPFQRKDTSYISYLFFWGDVFVWPKVPLLPSFLLQTSICWMVVRLRPLRDKSPLHARDVCPIKVH